MFATSWPGLLNLVLYKPRRPPRRPSPSSEIARAAGQGRVSNPVGRLRFGASESRGTPTCGHDGDDSLVRQRTRSVPGSGATWRRHVGDGGMKELVKLVVNTSGGQELQLEIGSHTPIWCLKVSKEHLCEQRERDNKSMNKRDREAERHRGGTEAERQRGRVKERERAKRRERENERVRAVSPGTDCDMLRCAVQEELERSTGQVRGPTTWTIFQQDGPNHLGL